MSKDTASELVKQIPAWLFSFSFFAILILLIISFITGRTFKILGGDIGVNGSPIGNLSSFPKGIILAWNNDNSAVPIPTGWRICDGKNNTPDLTGKFLKGVSSYKEVAVIGGESGFSGRSTGSTVLTIPQIPKHRHLEFLSGQPGNENGYVYIQGQAWRFDNFDGNKYTEYEGGDKGHTHTLPDETNEPPFYSVIYIIKVE